jgi:hypothetical protein
MVANRSSRAGFARSCEHRRPHGWTNVSTVTTEIAAVHVRKASGTRLIPEAFDVECG